LAYNRNNIRVTLIPSTSQLDQIDSQKVRPPLSPSVINVAAVTAAIAI
jgi:hypothetical protein